MLIHFIVLCFFLYHRESFVEWVENIPERVRYLLSFSEKFLEVLQRGLPCRGVGMRPGGLYNVSVVALSCPGSPQNILGLRHFLRTGVGPFPELWTLLKTLQVRLDSNCYAWTFSLDRTGGHQRWWRTTLQSQIRRNITETYGKMNFKCLWQCLWLDYLWMELDRGSFESWQLLGQAAPSCSTEQRSEDSCWLWNIDCWWELPSSPEPPSWGHNIDDHWPCDPGHQADDTGRRDRGA